MAHSFKDKARKKENALVVDLLNLCFRWKHQGRTDYRYDVQKTIESLAASYQCGTIIITADWGSSTYRKELLPSYKDNRKALREKQTEEDAAFFEEFIAEYGSAMDVLSEKYPVLKFKGVEADDIAAYIAGRHKKLGFNKVWLISSDRDWDLLVTDKVSRFSYVTRKETTLENWSTHYDVSPEEYISYKCLTGDTGDNIPGVPGIGPKRAATLIEMYGSAMDIYDAMPLPGKYKYIQNLNDSEDLLLLNYELMDLETYCSAAIGYENIEEMLCQLDTMRKG